MGTIEKVLTKLPTKIVSGMGSNFYLILEMDVGDTFIVFYRNYEKDETTEECRFILGDRTPEFKIEEMLNNLYEKGFRVFSSTIDKEFRSNAPRLLL